MSSKRVLVVVPALNEEATVGRVVQDLRGRDYDVLVVDDCSTDNTYEEAKHAGAEVLRLPINLGVGGALRAGFKFAVEHGYLAVVQVDADEQHPVNQIEDLERAAYQHDAHLVIGSRYLSTDATFTTTIPRRFSMWCLGRIASRISGIPLTDTTSGFRLIREPLLRSFATEFPVYYLGDTYEATVAAARAGYRVVEIPAAIGDRQFGSSSATTQQAVWQIARVVIVGVASLHPRIARLKDS